MKILFTITMAWFLTGCATTTWWPEVDSQEKCSDNKWKPDGHINTTHIVSNIAGVSPLKAEKYALYSQVPDAQWFRFSAPAVSVWATFIPWEWDYRYEINAVLHSLHGGNNEQVELRREKLKALIQEYRTLESAENDWKIGFLIHALGDSYSHVYKESTNNTEEAYGPGIGHLIERGAYSPDSIYDNLDNYLLYINALYDSLNTGSGNKTELYKYIAFIKKLAKSEDDKYISENIAKHNEYSAPPTNYCAHIGWSKKVNKSGVSDFLKSVECRLNEKNITKHCT